MSELEAILRWLLDQIVPSDDMTFVRGTLWKIEQQLEVPADALPKARALKKRIQTDMGQDLFEVGISLPQAFKKLESMRNAKQLSDADWKFVVDCHAKVTQGAILETKVMEKLLALAEK